MDSSSGLYSRGNDSLQTNLPGAGDRLWLTGTFRDGVTHNAYLITLGWTAGAMLNTWVTTSLARENRVS